MVKQYKSKFWRTHQPVLYTIEYTEIFDDKFNQPIFVLDDDPKMCAHCLTMYYIKQYIDLIVNTMIKYRGTLTAIKKSGVEDKPRVDYMFYNQRTAYWFYTLYKEMQEIYKKATGRYYRVSEYYDDKWLFNTVGIRGPIGVAHRAHKGVRLLKDNCLAKQLHTFIEPYEKQLKTINNINSRFRLMYMILGFLASEFPLGAPAWYNNMKATIWKSYNNMTRLYYRIDTSVEGVYSYYYSVDDKNWINIPNVPLEMRNIIDGIIFAREC